MQICVTQKSETEQVESACLAELMKKMLNHYDETAREREEKKRYFQSRGRSGFCRGSNSQQIPQESQQQRGCQGSHWTPHEGSQRWPYAAQEVNRNYIEQLPPMNQAQSHEQQTAMQTIQGRHSTFPMAAARQ